MVVMAAAATVACAAVLLLLACCRVCGDNECVMELESVIIRLRGTVILPFTVMMLSIIPNGGVGGAVTVNWQWSSRGD